MTQSQAPVTGTAHLLPFDKLSWEDFERMCLWLVRREGYEKVEHLGASGGEQGRDITACREGQLWAFQCKRVRSFGPQDALAEVEKILALPEAERPVGLVFLVTCNVSDEARKQARARCAEEKVECLFWVSTELDERVKRYPDIVKEFFRISIPLTAPVPPAQRVPPHFVERKAKQITNLKKALASSDKAQAIVGMPGVGKTTLAAHLAIQLEDEFPGGIFWADLPANGGDPLPVLASWAKLCDCDVDASDLLTPQANAQVVRGILNGRVKEEGRLLVVIDDVRKNWLGGACDLQLACPPGVPLLLTTRNEELALALNAKPHQLDMLTLDQALKLLAALASQVVHQDPEAARRLAKQVGYLPLALELAGKLAALRARKPGWRLVKLCAQVEDRLFKIRDGVIEGVLQIKGQPGLTVAFSLSYEALNAEQQRLFRALGVFAPVPFVPKHVAAVLGWEEEVTEKELDALVVLSLAHWERIKGKEELRYTLHPALHSYAAMLLKASSDWRDICDAYTKHYLAYAKQYDQDGPAGYAALGTEHQNLVVALKHLGERAEDKQAAEQYLDMLECLTDYLRSKGYWQEYRCHAEQAYTTACGLKEWHHAGWLACEVADTYSLEGWRGTDLERAEEWVKRGEKCLAHIVNESEEKLLRADTLRSRGIIAMRRCQYEDSRNHFVKALHLLEKLGPEDKGIYQDIEDIHIYLAKLEMRYNDRSVDHVCRYYTALGHSYQALGSAAKRDDEKQQALIKTNMAELMIWWGEWDGAEQVLEEAVFLSHESGRKALLAKGLALEAFAYQHKSVEESDRDKKIKLLDTALKKAKQSLETLTGTPSGDHFLNLCATYLLLAGLHRCRQDVCGDAEDSGKFEEYLSKARNLLEERKTVCSGVEGKLELDPDACPNACYEEACYRVMAESPSAGGAELICELLSVAVVPQPGWYNRAKTDFRLGTFRKDERQWKIFDERVKKGIKRIIIGDEQPHQPEDQA